MLHIEVGEGLFTHSNFKNIYFIKSWTNTLVLKYHIILYYIYMCVYEEIIIERFYLQSCYKYDRFMFLFLNTLIVMYIAVCFYD